MTSLIGEIVGLVRFIESKATIAAATDGCQCVYLLIALESLFKS